MWGEGNGSPSGHLGHQVGRAGQRVCPEHLTLCTVSGRTALCSGQGVSCLQSPGTGSLSEDPVTHRTPPQGARFWWRYCLQLLKPAGKGAVTVCIWFSPYHSILCWHPWCGTLGLPQDPASPRRMGTQQLPGRATAQAQIDFCFEWLWAQTCLLLFLKQWHMLGLGVREVGWTSLTA